MFLCFPFVGRAFRPSIWPSEPPSTSRRHPPSLRFTPQIPSPIKTTRMHGASGQMNGGNRATAKPRGHFTGDDILGSAMSTGGGRKAPVRKTARNPPQDPSCVCVSLLRPVHGVVRGPWGGWCFQGHRAGTKATAPHVEEDAFFVSVPCFSPCGSLRAFFRACQWALRAVPLEGEGGALPSAASGLILPVAMFFSSPTNPVRLATFSLEPRAFMQRMGFERWK